jgi:hypothetical protein
VASLVFSLVDLLALLFNPSALLLYPPALLLCHQPRLRSLCARYRIPIFLSLGTTK